MSRHLLQVHLTEELDKLVSQSIIGVTRTTTPFHNRHFLDAYAVFEDLRERPTSGGTIESYALEVGRILLGALGLQPANLSGSCISISSDNPLLLTLPWELIADSDDFLLQTLSLAIVRTHATCPRRFQPGTELRLAVHLASPEQEDDLACEFEAASIAESGVQAYYSELGTIADLTASMQACAANGLHIGGHGMAGGITLEAETGAPAHYQGNALIQLLQPIIEHEQRLQMAYVATCESGDASLAQHSVGSILHSLGVPCVITFSGPLPDVAAVSASRAFYSEIMASGQIDPAVRAARKSLEGYLPLGWSALRTWHSGKYWDDHFPASDRRAKITLSDRMVLGRRSEARRTRRALAAGQNVALLGPLGAGKGAIIAGLTKHRQVVANADFGISGAIAGLSALISQLERDPHDLLPQIGGDWLPENQPLVVLQRAELLLTDPASGGGLQWATADIKAFWTKLEMLSRERSFLLLVASTRPLPVAGIVYVPVSGLSDIHTGRLLQSLELSWLPQQAAAHVVKVIEGHPGSALALAKRLNSPPILMRFATEGISLDVIDAALREVFEAWLMSSGSTSVWKSLDEGERVTLLLLALSRRPLRERDFPTASSCQRIGGYAIGLWHRGLLTRIESSTPGDVSWEATRPFNSLVLLAARDRAEIIRYCHTVLARIFCRIAHETRDLAFGEAAGFHLFKCDRLRQCWTLTNTILQHLIGEGRAQLALPYVEDFEVPHVWKNISTKFQAQVQGMKGLILDNLGRPREALRAYRRSISLHRKARDARGLAVALSNIATIFMRAGRARRALALWEEAADAHEREKDYCGAASCLVEIASVAQRSGDLDGARRFLEKAEVACRLCPVPELHNLLESRWANYYTDAGNEAAAEAIWRKHATSSSLTRKAIALCNLSQSVINRNPPEALALIQESVRVAKQAGDREIEAASTQTLGAYFYAHGLWVLARLYLLRALRISETLMRPELEVRCLSLLSLCEWQLMNIGPAFALVKRAVALARRNKLNQMEDMLEEQITGWK